MSRSVTPFSVLHLAAFILLGSTAARAQAVTSYQEFSERGGSSESAVNIVKKGILSNPVPIELARIIPGGGKFTTLGPPSRPDVYVTAAEDIAGMNATQIALRLAIHEAETFTVIRFLTPLSGLASPVNRLDPGFIGTGRTAGGAREFVVPNGPIPAGATIEMVGP